MKNAKTMIENVYGKMEKQQAKERKRRAAAMKICATVSGLCLTAALALGIGLGMGAFTEKTPEKSMDAVYKVLLDVNPSIEISVSEEDIIMDVQSLNTDAEAIIEGKDIEGKELSEGVNTLLDELVDKGYISKEANSVLVSIEGARKEKADKVKDKLTNKIQTELAEKKVEGSVIVQQLPENSAASLKGVAAEYGISPGKAQMIAQIIEKNGLHTYEELAPMTVHQLNVLRHEYYANHIGVQVKGDPSTTAYIGEQKAIEIATIAAAVTPAETKVELTCHKGSMVYCVEFEDDTYDYRYRINAVTGEILTAEKVQPGKDKFREQETSTDMIGERAALDAALVHAGVENGKLIRCKCKGDWVNNMAIYDIYFTDGITSGSYVINSRTGEIVKYKVTKEPKDRSVSAEIIGEQTASSIALAKDGLVEGNVSKYEMNLKQKDDGYIYDLMFICNGVKYKAEIAAGDGTVLCFDKQNLKETGAPSAETEKTPSPEADKGQHKQEQPEKESEKPPVETEKDPAIQGDKGQHKEEGNGQHKETGKTPSAETEKQPSKEGK